MPEVTIDKVILDTNDGTVILSLTQPDPWEETSTLEWLQEQLNGYISAIESGAVAEQFPAILGKPVKIRLVFYREMPKEIQLKMDQVNATLGQLGIGFELMQIKVGYP